MADRITLPLYEPAQAHKALMHAWTHIKAWLTAGHRLVLTVAPDTRSSQQNRLLHAMLGEIAQQVEWAGAKRDTECWKRLTTAAWLRARGESVEVLPAIDGHGIDVVFRRTSKLTRAECSELTEYVAAWGAEHGVVFSGPGEWVGGETGDIAC